MKPTYEQLERQLATVVAENAGLKQAAEFATAPDMWEELGGDVLRYQYKDWYVDELKAAMKIPATDAYLAEVRAQAIRDALDSSSDYLDTDCVMDRLDISYEDAESRTSGAIELHDALVAIASELRQGAERE